ncbi:hypothetical protein [Bogoriella caseilytica]|uniref:hypothetical protein n=1 Tax=Bogoriella caseilytica TaxID=56055 RepID=UPI000F4AA0D5|nr:hypothetical protein [Bogoriella caseilytica]
MRRFDPSPLTLVELGAVLWYAYGQRVDGGRTVPSAHGVITEMTGHRPLGFLTLGRPATSPHSR